MKLKGALNSSGFCKSLWIRMATTAFSLNEYLDAKKFPEELFTGDPAVWNPEVCLEKGLVDRTHAHSLRVDIDTKADKKWADFNVVITHSGDLEFAEQHLKPVIPKYSELAILIIGPQAGLGS